ncbi:Anaphase-promoting complex subunit 11 [Mizuhopecten yessoensis]|uniref:Anaphase-promoting complex subunit 11 n=1 Tax=Mizuhopecten yessoensis TaxID=6573 RepID=A0A210QB60_MIZYE|nr:Anaphase-promoting complex subunit 11 [Mizuhopecten yessoensis]
MAFDGCCPDCKLPGDDCPLVAQLPAGEPAVSDVSTGLEIQRVTETPLQPWSDQAVVPVTPRLLHHHDHLLDSKSFTQVRLVLYMAFSSTV